MLNAEELCRIWKQIIVGEQKSYVLFEKGTCVILMEPEGDLSAQARELLGEWGPVHPGSPAGDFGVIYLSTHPGWVIACHHNDILTYVSPVEMGEEPSEVAIGLYGRQKRDEDARSLTIIHVEDRRQTPVPEG